MPAKRPDRPTPRPRYARVEVLLEDIRAQNAATIDAVHVLERRMDAGFASVEERFTVIEAVVRQNSADIRQNSADIRQNSADIRRNSDDIRQNTADIRQNSADIRQNSADIQGLGAKLDRKADASFEARVEALERPQR